MTKRATRLLLLCGCLAVLAGCVKLTKCGPSLYYGFIETFLHTASFALDHFEDDPDSFPSTSVGLSEAGRLSEEDSRDYSCRRPIRMRAVYADPVRCVVVMADGLDCKPTTSDDVTWTLCYLEGPTTPATREREASRFTLRAGWFGAAQDFRWIDAYAF